MTSRAGEVVQWPLVANHVRVTTGGFWVACPLPSGIDLQLFGSLYAPRLDGGGRPLFPVGQRLLGSLWSPAFVEVSQSLQEAIERSGVFAGLPVRWTELSGSVVRWFDFGVELGQVAEIGRRLWEYAERAGSASAEPRAAPDASR